MKLNHVFQQPLVYLVMPVLGYLQGAVQKWHFQKLPRLMHWLQGFSKDYQCEMIVDLRIPLKTCWPARPCTEWRHLLPFALQVMENTLVPSSRYLEMFNFSLGRFARATLTASGLWKFATHATTLFSSCTLFPQEWRSMWATRIITSINFIVFHESSNFMQLLFYYRLTHCVLMSIHLSATLPFNFSHHQ